jgi:hypothetical protein
MIRRAGIGRALWTMALLGVGLRPSLVVAAEPASRSQLYEVPADCPNRQQWRDALSSRLPERWRARAEAHDFTVRIERSPAHAHFEPSHVGTLGTSQAGANATRTVSGASCRAVADALALIAAFEMQRTDAAPLPASAPEQPGIGPAGDGPNDLQTTTAPAPSHRLQLGITGFVLLQSITAPGLTADVGLGLTVSWQTEILQPWLMFGVYWGDDQVELGDRQAEAEFERWSAHVVGCPLRFPRRSAAAVRPCLNVDLGLLEGRGRGVSLARGSPALLASAGAEVRLEWVVMEALELGAGVGGVLTLSRPRFYFSPEFTALEVPAAGLRASASARVSF